MRDTLYELSRALDDLPHIVGATCATTSYRSQGVRKPTRDEFRQEAADYFGMIADHLARDERLSEHREYIMRRISAESQRILDGKNAQIERRYDRYVDYG